MAKKGLKMLFKDNVVNFTIDDSFHLVERDLYTGFVRVYDLSRDDEKMVFQGRLKHYSRFVMRVQISTSVLYYLHSIRWL